ncbi:hypothetical protein [Spirillospora sp. NPDC048819]|uniref:hypothetical protein n=1 Tax=Spirillospora sp. NPDC048819 TaxID=3155268 RepID=UPI003411A716
MNPHERRRVDLLAALCGELERRGLPSWVTPSYGTCFLRCVRLNPRRTILIACVRGPGTTWLFVWSGGHAHADDIPRAAALVSAYFAS